MITLAVSAAQAEAVVFGAVTTGAANDLLRVAEIARAGLHIGRVSPADSENVSRDARLNTAGGMNCVASWSRCRRRCGSSGRSSGRPASGPRAGR